MDSVIVDEEWGSKLQSERNSNSNFIKEDDEEEQEDV